MDAHSVSTTDALYSAPKDVRTIIIPTKVWEDKSQPSKFGRDKSFTWKDVYVEDGKRKVPRGDTEEQVEDSSEDSRKRAAEKEATEAKARKRAISFVDIEDESLFEEDLNYKEPKKEFPGPYDPERVRQLYTSACKVLDVMPCTRFMRSVRSGRVIAGHQGFGPRGARAVAISLITNLTTTELIIPGNKLGPEGMYCMARLIQGNEVIKVLDISDNNLGREGAKILAEAIRENESIMEISAAGNKFDDKTGGYFEEALKVNTQVRQLDLSRNLFCELGGIQIARGLEENHTITHIDLSYNQLRRNGIRGIAKMLSNNDTLLNLDLSWNGVGTDGARQLGEGLNNNRCLAVLSLNATRLNLEGLMAMLGNMKENTVLKALQIKHNPVTNADLCLFMKAIDTLPDLGINFIDASSVIVSSEFLDLVKRVAKTKKGFVVAYQGLLSIKDSSRNMLEDLDLTGGDPLEALIKYTRSKNLRLVDLFAQFDIDKSGSMTRQELIHGVANAGIPLSIKQMDRLVAKLDTDGDGEIDFAELLDGYKKYMRNLHRQGRVTRKVFKVDNKMFPGLKSDEQAQEKSDAKTKAKSTLRPPSRSSAVSQSQSGPLERDKESEDNSGMDYQSEEWSDYLDIVEEDSSQEGME